MIVSTFPCLSVSCLVQEKAELQKELDTIDERVEDLVTLEVRLSAEADRKRSAIGASRLEAGEEFKDDDAGVSIVYAPL